MIRIEAKKIILHRMALVFFTMFLAACGGDSGGDMQQPAADDSGLTDEEIARYQEKVSRKVSSKFGGALVNAMVEDWGISRDQAECLKSDPRIVDVERISNGDPDVLALFDECGVDPAVVK